MERLTFLDSFKEPCYRLDNTVYKNEISQRLAAYEDTGMTPEEIIGITDLLEANKAGKVVQYIPGDTVYDCFGMSWTVTSSEIHKFGNGPLRYLYRCGHPGIDDYCALYSDEIVTRQEAERITINE